MLFPCGTFSLWGWYWSQFPSKLCGVLQGRRRGRYLQMNSGSPRAAPISQTLWQVRSQGCFSRFSHWGLSLESRTRVGPRAQQWAEEPSLGEALSGAADWSHSRQRKSRRVWIRVWSWQPPRHLQSCFLHGVPQSPWGNQFPELLLGDMDTGCLCFCIWCWVEGPFLFSPLLSRGLSLIWVPVTVFPPGLLTSKSRVSPVHAARAGRGPSDPLLWWFSVLANWQNCWGAFRNSHLGWPGAEVPRQRRP